MGMNALASQVTSKGWEQGLRQLQMEMATAQVNSKPKYAL